MEELWQIHLDTEGWIIFMLAGIITGVINTLAGSGSVITLPIFIFICGLPAPVANGTNRIGVMLQSIVGVYNFNKQGQLPREQLGWLLIPELIGAIVGALIAVDIDEEQMNLAIGFLMVFMLIILLVRPNKWIKTTTEDRSRNRKWFNILIFTAIGFYGGFIQAGVGLFLLSALVVSANYSLVKANSIKLLSVAMFSIPALLIFLYNQQVHVGYGLLMATFQSIGAYLGVRFASRVPNADKWIHRLLIIIVMISAGKFLGPWLIEIIG